MPKVINKITKLEKISISNDEYKTRKKINLRTKELLIQMIYRKMMGDKLTLSDLDFVILNTIKEKSPKSIRDFIIASK